MDWAGNGDPILRILDAGRDNRIAAICEKVADKKMGFGGQNEIGIANSLFEVYWSCEPLSIPALHWRTILLGHALLPDRNPDTSNESWMPSTQC